MRKFSRSVRFDLVEIIVIAGVTALVGAWVAVWQSRSVSAISAMVGLSSDIARMELTPLASTYGPDRTSQFAEEWIIRDAFRTVAARSENICAWIRKICTSRRSRQSPRLRR